MRTLWSSSGPVQTYDGRAVCLDDLSKLSFFFPRVDQKPRASTFAHATLPAILAELTSRDVSRKRTAEETSRYNGNSSRCITPVFRGRRFGCRESVTRTGVRCVLLRNLCLGPYPACAAYSVSMGYSGSYELSQSIQRCQCITWFCSPRVAAHLPKVRWYWHEVRLISVALGVCLDGSSWGEAKYSTRSCSAVECWTSWWYNLTAK